MGSEASIASRAASLMLSGATGLPTRNDSAAVALRLVDAALHRPMPASANVSASVKYDTLTRTFTVTRALDGRMAGADNTENEAVVHDMLTKFDQLPLFSSAGLEPNAEYYLRVRARTTPRTSWVLWPLWAREVAGTAKFTFIP